MTQRDLGKKLRKPQSWVFNCESANRRVDVTEFILWARACGVESWDALLESYAQARQRVADAWAALASPFKEE